MSALHTPGPWVWAPRAPGHAPYLRTPHSGLLTVMDFVRCGMQGAEPRFSDRNGERRGGLMHRASEIDIHTHPDARLIAAAPDLLDACQFALAEALAYAGEEENDDSPNGEVIRRLRAAIAVATEAGRHE